MEMIRSSICADTHIKIVRAAIAEALAKAKTEEAKKLLSEVLEQCEANICE
jgi:HEAT repeat protein